MLGISGLLGQVESGQAAVLDALAGEGVLTYRSNTAQRSGDKTERMLSLDVEAGAAAARYVLSPFPDETPIWRVTCGEGVGSIAPQRLRPERVEKFCDLFLRPSGVYGPCHLAVCSGGRTVARYRRRRLSPGEMERLVLPRALLEQCCGDLTISVEEDTP